MRPPEHWHLRPQPQRVLWPWFALVGLAIVMVAVTAVCLGTTGGPAPGAAVAAPTARATPASFGAEPAVRTAGRAAAVIEASCGALLYGQAEHERRPPASVTKIATALVAVEHAGLDAIVDVRVNSALLAASTDSTIMGLEPGQRLTLRDLLYGLLLVSGNDAAIAIAEHVGGTTAAFVDMMNAKVAQLGLRDTHFANPHGLDEAAHFASAYDLALLGRALLEDDVLASIVRTESYQPDWDGPPLWNGNELLERYPGTIGVKTGLTELAGQTIVAAAERDGRRLIVAVMGSSDRYTDAIGLFDWAFAHTSPACTPEAALGLP